MLYRIISISLSVAVLSGCMTTDGTGYSMNQDTPQERQRLLETGLNRAKGCWEGRKAAYPELYAKFDEIIGTVPPGSRGVPLAFQASTKPIPDELKALFLQSTAQPERAECRELELRAFNDYHPRFMSLRQRFHERQDKTVLKVLSGELKTVGEYWREVESARQWARAEDLRIVDELNQQLRQDATLAAQQRAAQWQAYQAQQAEQRRQDDAMWAPYKQLLRPKTTINCRTIGSGTFSSTTCREQ